MSADTHRRRMMALAGLIAGPLTVGSAQAADSAYTSLVQCKALPTETAEDASASIARCPGRDGFTVLLTSGDSRSWLVFKHPTGGTSDLMQDVMRLTPGQFPAIAGRMLEWRTPSPGAHATAVIFRVGGSDPDDPNKPAKAVLLVGRITDGKVQVIGAAPNNEDARRMADGLSRR
jgi:hypothetical protein